MRRQRTTGGGKGKGVMGVMRNDGDRVKQPLLVSSVLDTAEKAKVFAK